MSRPCPFKAEAKAKGLKRYRNGIPCPHGHADERVVATGACYTCALVDRNRRYAEDGGREKGAAVARERRRRDPRAERQRQIRVNLKSRYGLTEAQYAAMYEAQLGKCAVCEMLLVSRLDASRPLYSGRGAPTKELARVDHCHTTGRVRGLLCHECNTGLGKFQDSPKILLSAVRYLQATSGDRAFETANSDNRWCDDTAQGEKRADASRHLVTSTSRGTRLQEVSPFFN